MLPKLRQTLPWALYNFASTIYAINIISLYFALWVTIDMNGADILYSIAFSTSVFFAAICAPLVGNISDRVGRRMPFLILFAVLCFIGTMTLGFAHNLFVALLIFTLTNFFYQSGEIVSNMLIPQVSGGEDVGKVAGYGTGLGYFGTIAGVLLVSPIVLKYGRQAAFIPTAVLFMLFALPSFFLIKDPKQKQIAATSVFKKLKLTDIRKYPDFAISLLAVFIAFNTIDTIFIFMSVYLKKVIGFHDSEFTWYYVACSSFSILSGVCSGFIVDKCGARKILVYSLLLWCLALFIAMLSTQKWVFWFVGPLVGLSLGATWTSSRTLIVELAPREKSGEFFGFYGMVIKMAAIVGPLLWGICIWAFGSLGMIKYRLTLGVLLLLVITGLIILRYEHKKTNLRFT